MNAPLKVGDHLNVQWGAYGYRYARVTKVTKRGNVYAQRWMVADQKPTAPRRIYLWPDGDWCIKPYAPPPPGTVIETRDPSEDTTRRVPWLTVGQIKTSNT